MTSRPVAVGLASVTFAVAGISVVQSPPAPKPDPNLKRTVGYGQIRYAGLGPEKWAQRYRQEHQTVLWQRQVIAGLRAQAVKSRRLMLREPQVVEAINLACATYGYCSTLWRKARCETGGTFDPNAKNRRSSASGLFQFLSSTWASTPFGRFSVFSPYANALAAGWMHEQGRGGEWTCG